jgi:Flp pilus assembly protein TadG
MLSSATSHLDRFRSDERGAIAILFGLCTMIVVLMVGMGVDIGRVMHANSKISAALDAAALAGARGLRVQNLSDSRVKDLVRAYFHENMEGSGGSYATINSFTVTIDRRNSSIGIDVDAEVPMMFGQAAGIDKISFPASTVAIFSSKDIELSVQLDVTGSMRPRGKIEGLRSAMIELLDIMLPDAGTSNSVRVALAPFASSVNAGALASVVTDNRSGADNCVFERDGAQSVTDAAPAAGAWFKVAGDAGVTGSRNTCPAGPAIVPLSGDKRMLRDEVARYGTYTATAGHLGTAWAWYMLSPKWATLLPASARPVAYNDGKTMKTAILMTDGVYNTVGGVNTGDVSVNSRESQRRAKELCANMKNEGVIVYTIGFDLENAGAAKADAIAVLSACASSADKFYRAERPEELRAAFRTIAEEITNLRISK